MRITKKDYFYNISYIILLIAYYLFNVEVFNFTFEKENQKYEWCDYFYNEYRKNLTSKKTNINL